MRVGSSVPRMFAQTTRPIVAAHRPAQVWPSAVRGLHVPRVVAGTVLVQMPNMRALLNRLSELANELLAPAPALVPASALPEPEPEDSSPGLWDGLLWAAPKKKVSHSRKAMRHANKGLKDRIDLVHCPSCARPKLQHHLCEHCYGEFAREVKRAEGSRSRG